MPHLLPRPHHGLSNHEEHQEPGFVPRAVDHLRFKSPGMPLATDCQPSLEDGLLWLWASAPGPELCHFLGFPLSLPPNNEGGQVLLFRQ